MQTANERRRKLLEAVCRRRYDTISNLASEFCVSQKTISRDLILLSCSYPLYTRRGRTGGVYVAEGYKLDKNYFTPEQAELIERVQALLSGRDKKVAESILNKFRLPSGGEKRNEAFK